MAEGFVIGIDIGGTSVKAGLFTAAGELLERRSFKSAELAGGVIDDCCGCIEELIGCRGLKRSQVVGAGFGVPGPVDPDGVVRGCVNMAGWQDVPLAAEIKRRCGVKAAVQNDANVAALGEYWLGAGKGRQSMVMITLGTGVGCAAVINGKLLGGAHNTGGEGGHICVDRSETEVCSCGKRGCLEQYASATGLVRVASRLLAASPGADSPLRQGELTAKRIAGCAAQGDAIASAAFGRMTDALAFGIAAITTLIDPEIIVLGGGVSLAGEPLRAEVDRRYRGLAYKDMRDTEITLSRLSADAGIYGAAYLALGSLG